MEGFDSDIKPQDIGFDAAVEFAPDRNNTGPSLFNIPLFEHLQKLGLFPKGIAENYIYDYDTIASTMLRKPAPDYVRFPCVTPSWDNSARRQKKATIIVNSTPDKYEEWLADSIKRANKQTEPPLVFINAWNEWAEGNHLEPDQKWGHAYLKATLNAVTHPNKDRQAIRRTPNPLNVKIYINHIFNRHVGWRFK